MHIAIDCREALRPKKTGKGVWTHGLIEELLTRNVELTFVTDTRIPSHWHAGNHHEYIAPGTGIFWHLNVQKELQHRSGLDFYLSTTSYIVPAIAGNKIPCATVVHDLIAFHNEPHDQKAKWIERLTLGSALRKSKKIFTVSENTKHDLLLRFPGINQDRVTPIFAGPLRENPPLNRPEKNFIFCAATLCPRKNQKRLIEAYESLPDLTRSKYALILVGGRGWHDADIVQLAKNTPNVTWMDYVSDDQYEELLSTCTVFALPSLYEGFGMQILDALQRGIPILTSDRGSLKEVAGDAALMVDPEDTVSIANGLDQLLANDERRSELRKKGPLQAKNYTWQHTADLLLSTLKQSKS